jgi:hypothetical protein
MFMKNTLLCFSFILWCLFIEPQTGHCSQKPEEIDPCSLIAAEKLFLIFPALTKAEKQTVGQASVCNYLDKSDIPALIISVTKAGTHARDTLSMLDSGYVIEEITGLGDEAAIAIQQANPTFGLKESIAALHIKKENISFNFSFFRISIQSNDVKFEGVKALAAEMLDKF